LKEVENFMNYKNMKQFFFLVNFVFLLGMISTAQASAELAEPQKAIEKASVKLQKELKDDGFLTDFAKINHFVEEVIEPHMDFNKISKLVVGKHWRRASEEEKKNFEKEFKILLVRTYSRAFIGFDDWSVDFLPLDMNKAVKQVKNTKAVTVRTKIIQPGKSPFTINYKMWLVDGKWKTYDVVLEGVSLVKNFRTSISRRMSKPGASLSKVTAYLSKKNITALNRLKEEDKQS